MRFCSDLLVSKHNRCKHIQTRENGKTVKVLVVVTAPSLMLMSKAKELAFSLVDVLI